MLYNDRIDLSERIDINKISASKECYIFHRWYLLDKGGFAFQPNFWNSCHDVLVMSVSLKDIAILNRISAGYLCIMNRISKNDTVNSLQKLT